MKFDVHQHQTYVQQTNVQNADGCGCGGCAWLIVIFVIFAAISGSCGV